MAQQPVTRKKVPPAICRTLGTNASAVVFLKWPGR